jgi:Spy/CpxP family protein refolding chaperone
MFRRLSIIVIVSLCLSTLAEAQAKKPAIGNFPFWSQPKQEFSDQFVPGLNAALLLSDEQIVKLHEARRETIDNEQLRGKKDKSVEIPESEREARRKATQEAYTNLRTKVSNILTAEQRTLIEQINAAHLEVTKAASDEFGPQLTGAKGNDDLQKRLQQEKRDRIAANFKAKLESILSPNQKAAWEQAAAQEIANAAKPKPQK